MGLCVVLDRAGHQCRVILNGHEITESVAVIDIHAQAGQPPLVTLTISAPVQLMGETNLLLRAEEPKP